MFCAAGISISDRSTLLKGRPHEEQRAVLGAFAVTSMLVYQPATFFPIINPTHSISDGLLRISNIFKHAPGLRWSPYLDIYLSNLAHSSKVPQDESLTAMVKMQLIANQIYDDSLYANGGRPPVLYLSALRSQLHEITRQGSLSAEVRNDRKLKL